MTITLYYREDENSRDLLICITDRLNNFHWYINNCVPCGTFAGTDLYSKTWYETCEELRKAKIDYYNEAHKAVHNLGEWKYIPSYYNKTAEEIMEHEITDTYFVRIEEVGYLYTHYELIEVW